MNSTQERLAFSERLQQALRNAEYSPHSPTQLAREFNERFKGHPVTVHAARKWLQGESIPTQEKLPPLAGWLDAVPYTPPTLPTNLRVSPAVLAVSATQID